MKNDLSCAVVGDLLPTYVEGLTAAETNEAVERHLAGCPDCAARLAAMRAPEAAEQAETDKEVDYLKTVRRRLRRRVALAVALTVLVLAGLWAAKVYVVGSPADRDARPMNFSVHTHPAEETIDLRILTGESSPAYWGWEMVREGDTVTITAREGRPSPLHPRQEFLFVVDVAGVREVSLCGRLLWQDGVTLLPDAQAAYGCRTPYAGNASALGALARALIQAGRLPDGFTVQLQTAQEPYGWTLVYDAAPGDPDQLDRQLEAAAPLLLALVENLGEVSWTYPDADGTLRQRTVTLDQADAALAERAEAYRLEFGLEPQVCAGVKDHAASAADFQRLWDLLDPR